MKTICAWCGGLLADGPAHPVSHGICSACRAELETSSLAGEPVSVTIDAESPFRRALGFVVLVAICTLLAVLLVSCSSPVAADPLALRPDNPLARRPIPAIETWPGYIGGYPDPTPCPPTYPVCE